MTDKSTQLHKALKWSVIGFFIAGSGVGLGFAGHYFESWNISLAGYVIAALGIAISFLGAGAGLFFLVGIKNDDSKTPREKQPWK